MMILQWLILSRSSWTDLRFRKIFNRDVIIIESLEMAIFHRVNVVSAVVTFTVLLAARAVTHAGLGYGDIKLLTVLASWSDSHVHWLTFLALGFGCAGLYSILEAIFRRSWAISIPLVPALLVGGLLQYHLSQ
jgi:H+/Cl- antiporter ClcA